MQDIDPTPTVEDLAVLDQLEAGEPAKRLLRTLLAANNCRAMVRSLEPGGDGLANTVPLPAGEPAATVALLEELDRCMLVLHLPANRGFAGGKVFTGWAIDDERRTLDYQVTSVLLTYLAWRGVWPE